MRAHSIRQVLALLLPLLLVPSGHAFLATNSSSNVDLNAYIGDTSDVGTNSSSAIDLNFMVVDEPTGVYTNSSSVIDLNLGAIFESRKTFCGDGICQSDETCSTCPQDCGVCSSSGGSGGSGGGGGTSSAAGPGFSLGGGGGGGGAPETPVAAFPQPNMQITGVPGQISVKQGEFESIAVQVRNIGNIPLLGITLSIDGIPAEWFSAQADKASIGPGETATFVVKIIVPVSATVKPYPVFFSVKSSSASTGVESALRVIETTAGPAGTGASIKDVTISNAIVSRNASITATVSNTTNVTATFIVSLDAPPDWQVREKQIEVTLSPGEQRDVTFHFTAPGKSGVERAGMIIRNKGAGNAPSSTITKSFYVIINKPVQETALVTAGAAGPSSPVDVAVSAATFAVLTGLVIAFFASAKKMFGLGRL